MKTRLIAPEIWRVCILDDLYEVSTLGRVRRVSTGKLISCKPHKNTGYCIVGLCRDGKRKNYTVHTLVITTFKGRKPKGMECRHLDDVKSNNRLYNLQWGTRSENMKDWYRNGYVRSKYTSDLIAQSVKGKKLRPLTEETKRRISESRKRYFERKQNERI